MAGSMEATERSGRSLATLGAEHDELRRQVAVSDEEIDLLQAEVAKNKRTWYREPSVLVATLALVVSIGTFVAGQFNVHSDRQIQDRNRLSALIEQLPTAMAQNQEKPGTAVNDLPFLVAGSAAALIDKLGPEASTAPEKIEIAGGLLSGDDLPSAKRLATEAEQQSTNVLQKVYADRIIADVDFEAGNAASGRDVYRRAIDLLQTPQGQLDAPVLRDFRLFNIELFWVSAEFSFAKSCPNAREHLRTAKQALDRLPADRTGLQRTYLDNATKMVTAGCPTTIK